MTKKINKQKCKYCGLVLRTNDPQKKIHSLCAKIKTISGDRNLTYASQSPLPKGRGFRGDTEE